MPRRRLQLVCSSSDEDENDLNPIQVQPPLHQQDIVQEIIEPDEDDDDDRIISSINFQNVTIQSSSSSHSIPPPRNPNITQPVPFQISDSDSDADHVNDHHSVNTGPTPINTEYADGSIGSILRRMGLNLRMEWLESCVRGLESSVPGFSGFDDLQKAKLCLEQVMFADMNLCGAGVLPPNVHSLHLVDLKGLFVLQVDEIVNISCPLRGRYQNAAPGLKRCHKLSMTDGVQRVFGMEYRPIKDIEALSPAGLKVVVSNVNVRRGLLMLVPEVIEVLGGKVEELDAAQQRLIQEVNKPPRGKRTRTGVVPPLSTRATHSAWPPETSNAQEGSGGGSRTETMPPPVVHQGIPVRDVRSQSHTAPPHREDGGSYRSSSVAETAGIRMAAGPEQRSSGMPTMQTAYPVSEQADSIRVAAGPEQRSSGMPTMQTAYPFSELADSIRMAAGPEQRSSGMPTMQTAYPVSEQADSICMAAGSSGMPAVSRPDVASAGMDVEDIDMIDELEHSFLSTLEKDTPFTYLASLSAKWSAMKDKTSKVEGRIKCFLTGVKGFQFRQRTTYELRVYVDDGSLISEILIDHNVVQKFIAYSPVEVTTALAFSDTKRASDMKNTLKQFQVYLADFEGTMLVQMTASSSVPVAIDMNQGCNSSDALLLLERFRPSYSSFSRQRSQHPGPGVNTINLSP